MQRNAAVTDEFGRVYQEHVWRVYAFVAYRVRDRQLAEDLTQTTFERALRAWPRFDHRRASQATWLLAIARNLLIDHRRRDRPERRLPIEEGHLSDAIVPAHAPGEWPGLADALSVLSERDREVLALRFGGDLSGAEIATQLGLSLANVQQILSRSLRRLRLELHRREHHSGDGELEACASPLYGTQPGAGDDAAACVEDAAAGARQA